MRWSPAELRLMEREVLIKGCRRASQKGFGIGGIILRIVN
jgi:hypothetical protein